MKKKKGRRSTQDKKNAEPSPRNKAIHIPLDFEKAVIGLMKVKPKKDQEPT
jgi:hypothetical protein